MEYRKYLGAALAGIGAGAVTGLFGAGGGMVLVPLLGLLTPLKDSEIFPASITIILPMCVVSVMVAGADGSLAWRQAVPYLLGSAAGGILAGKIGNKIPLAWLHRGLGLLVLWGGYRYLC